MPLSRVYSAGRFALELDGQTAGFVKSVEGGSPFAEVVLAPPVNGDLAGKHLGGVAYEPIQISFGSGMAQPLYKWISDWLAGKSATKNGAVVFLDYNFTERSRLEFTRASITEVEFPALDAASKDAATIRLRLEAESTDLRRRTAGAGKSGFASKVKDLLATNFRLKIGKVTVSKVSKIDALTVKQGTKADVGRLQVPNLVFTVPESDAGEWFDWFDDFVINGTNAEDTERNGTIELLTSDLKTAVMTLSLSNMGIFRIRRERLQSGAEVVARVGVELYVERIDFVADEVIAGAEVVPPAAPPAAPPAKNAVRLFNAQIVAERLQAAVKAPAAASPTRRQEGSDIGTRWAMETATLDELEQIAALESRDWSAIRLADDHSLISFLQQAGVVPAGGDGALDLERDNFIEGIVAGSAQVLISATPHLKGEK